MDDSSDFDIPHVIEVGDIVTERDYIVSPDRTPWVGIVVYIEKDHYTLHSYLAETEDLIGVHWFQAAYVENLPVSVIELLQKAD